MSTLSETHVIDFPGFPTVVVHSPGQAMGTLPQFMDTAFRALGAAVQRGAFAPAVPAFSKYRGQTGGSGEAAESADRGRRSIDPAVGLRTRGPGALVPDPEFVAGQLDWPVSKAKTEVDATPGRSGVSRAWACLSQSRS